MKIESLYTAFLKSTSVSTDSRSIEKGALFFALKGTHFDGNKYAEAALKKGAAYVVVDQSSGLENDERVFCVENTLNTLQELATHHRKKLGLPIIALTGSNGKTTTKELIREVLSKKYNVLATSGNFNNHIGVPLTLLQLNNKHEIGVIEMGANHLKEIQRLCAIALPDWGYITNFGKAHLEGFGSEAGVVQGKSELYQHLKENKGKIVVNGNDLKQVELTKECDTFLFGDQEYNDFQISVTDPKDNSLGLEYDKYLFQSPLHGAYNLNNIAAAITFGILFDVQIEHIQDAIKFYDSKNNRSQKLNLKGIQIILDAYNANPSSMEAALDSFSSIDPKNSAVLLGDMLELGVFADKAHENLLKRCLELKFKSIYTYGPLFEKTKKTAPNIKKYTQLETLTNELKIDLSNWNHLLIKGSRSMQLERIITFIETL